MAKVTTVASAMAQTGKLKNDSNRPQQQSEKILCTVSVVVVLEAGGSVMPKVKAVSGFVVFQTQQNCQEQIVVIKTTECQSKVIHCERITKCATASLLKTKRLFEFVTVMSEQFDVVIKCFHKLPLSALQEELLGLLK